MPHKLIGMAVGAVLGILFIVYAFMQDGVIPYSNIAFWSAVIFLFSTATVSLLLKIVIGIFRIVKERDATAFTYFRHFYNFVLLSILLGGYVHYFYDPEKTEIKLVDFALNNAEIIGASIALIFSFSIFALQRMADFLPARHIQFLTKNSKEGVFFRLLVFLIFISLFIPIFFPDSPKLALWGLLITLLGCFFIVYFLYLGLSEKAYPEYSMKKIEDDTIKFLKETRKEHECLHQKNDIIDLFGSAQEKVRDLHEMGLKLLGRNDVQSFKGFLRHIKDISLEHLRLGDGCFISDANNPNFYTDSFLIAEIRRCLLSIGERLVQEKREELLNSLLHTYSLIIEGTLNIKYADKGESNGLPIAIFHDFQNLVKRAFLFKNDVLNFTMAQILMNLSERALSTGDFNLGLQQQLLNSLREAKKHCLSQNEEICFAISELEKVFK